MPVHGLPSSELDWASHNANSGLRIVESSSSEARSVATHVDPAVPPDLRPPKVEASAQTGGPRPGTQTFLQPSSPGRVAHRRLHHNAAEAHHGKFT